MNERRSRDGGKKIRERVRWRGKRGEKREGGQTCGHIRTEEEGGRDKRMDTAEMKRMEGHGNEIGWRRRKRE